MAYAPPLNIVLVDKSVQGSDWHDFAQAALQDQANAVAGYYHPTGIRVYGFGDPAPTRAWPVYIRNQCSLGGKPYAAFHWVYAGKPYGCISAADGGGFWWMTRAIEHETTEMVGDPNARGREIVDPVAQYFGGIDVLTGIFSFSYSSTIADYPFVDFLLPGTTADYLHQVKPPGGTI